MKISVGTGIDQYISQLEHLDRSTDEQIGKAVYAGADIIADAIKENLKNLPTDEGYAKESNKLQGIKKIQKIGLINSFGIARIGNDNGYMNVKTGFDGYNLLKTGKYPQGQPNAMIARTVEAGNSFTQKHPFVSPAIRANKEAAERKMAQVIDTEIMKVMK